MALNGYFAQLFEDAGVETALIVTDRAGSFSQRHPDSMSGGYLPQSPLSTSSTLLNKLNRNHPSDSNSTILISNSSSLLDDQLLCISSPDPTTGQHEIIDDDIPDIGLQQRIEGNRSGVLTVKPCLYRLLQVANLRERQGYHLRFLMMMMMGARYSLLYQLQTTVSLRPARGQGISGRYKTLWKSAVFRTVEIPPHIA
eukprot:scaffold2143_cov125-Cylindrotheca_fusiformis.AAC.20